MPKEDHAGKQTAVDDQEVFVGKVNQELYKRNAELAAKNKNLSLLRILYEISTRTLEPDQLSQEFVHTIRDTLNMEMVSIFLKGENENFLFPVATALSKQNMNMWKSFTEIHQVGISFGTDNNSCIQAIKTKKLIRSSDEKDIFSPMLSTSDIASLKKANRGDYLVYPLLTEKAVLGVLLIELTGTYDTLNEHEKSILESLVDVTAVAIDKASAYKELSSANDKLRKLDVAKSEFMSIASHQLRTPLAGIIGYLSMLEEGDYGDIQEEQMQVIQIIREGSQRLSRLVNTFLNVTRIEAGRLIMHYSKVPFTQVLDAAYNELQPTAEKKGVKLIYNKIDLPETEVDVDKIKDVVLNLTDNAIKYTPEGSVTLGGEAANGMIKVSVHDTGVGIEPKEAQNLFNKFVRGSNIARVQPDGSGLGLFIAKKIVDGHGGRIWAESKGKGEGTIFYFEIPIEGDKEAKQKGAEIVANDHAKKEDSSESK